MKDHEIAQLVNALRDCAVEFHDAQQLRERIATLVVPALRGVRSQAAIDLEGVPDEWLAEVAVQQIQNLTGANKGIRRLRRKLDKAREDIEDLRDACSLAWAAAAKAEASNPLFRRLSDDECDALSRSIMGLYGHTTHVQHGRAMVDCVTAALQQRSAAVGAESVALWGSALFADALQQSSSGITAGAEKPSQVVDFGAAAQNRTADLLITNQDKNTPETAHNQDVTPKTAPAQPDQIAPRESNGCEGVTAGSEPVHPSLRHVYEDEGTSNCAHGCGCWMGPFRSGGPDGIDPSPFARCPNAVPASDGELVDVYQLWVDQAWNGRRADDGNALRHLFIMSVGLGGEAGEVQELLKKHVRDGVMNTSDLLLELGDVAYYLTRIASWFGLSLRQVLEANQVKITERQAKGKTGVSS